MINPKEYIQELIDSGFTEEEAHKQLKEEMKKRKKKNLDLIKIQNDFSNSFRDNCQRYRR